jgi:hypothetical protein
MAATSLTYLSLSLFMAIVAAHAATPSETVMSTPMSSISDITSTATNTGNASVAEYSITALPAVQSQPSCIFNCLIPIGLADPSGCDDVTNECACLNAPNDVLGFLADCVQTVCTSSTSSYAAVVTNLYESYCQSVFGTAEFSQAFSMEAAAAASSSIAEMMSTMTTTTAETPSATAKSGAKIWSPTL